MDKPVKEILCFDHLSFDMIMEDNKWIETPPYGVSAISICSPNEEDLSEHWFKNDCHSKNHKYTPRVFNLDIDDTSPFWFENHESWCYDNALELYWNKHIKESNAYFSHLYISGKDKEFVDVLHCLDYEEAFDLVRWIDTRIKEDDTIYVHCAVGASRSQGVVRYIVDTYSNEYDIKLNPYNPNNTYNPHVVMMLKRAYRSEINSGIDNSYFNTEPMKFDGMIKLNIL